MTSRLLATLKQQQIPVVGFVNERKLYYNWNEVDQRVKALNMWLDSGYELGNHTYAHTSLNRAGLKEFEESVIEGEPVIKLLLAQHNMRLRFFRHPYLDVGLDLETRRASEAFLAQRGYRIAPVTLDGWDWMSAGVYDDAKKRGDAAVQQQVVNAYLAYHAQVFAYFETLSKELVGYEPKQILLLHANQLEADHVGELLDMIRKRGYHFISLDNAVSDAAYSLPDTYIGEGTNWIDHWAITRGQPPQGEPSFPQEILDLAQKIPRTTQP
jgi:peptidoglycan-N-acetylglucosamine deacetylase